MADVLWSLFYLALVATPFVVLSTALALAWRALRALIRLRSGGWHRPGGITCALSAAFAGGVAFGTYWWVGAAQGLDLGATLGTNEFKCPNGALGDHLVTHLTFPVSVECVTRRGARLEEVPGWVNPVVVAGLAVFALAVVEGVLGVRRRRVRAAGPAR
ncbi:hypothetical protein [Streptomyces sp. NPDC127039]|uniref:hypothetical protein n=1 Tax=Streptomyces sp. NPDC127039 TaxID=3347115 RepID=UPI00364ABD2B